MTTLAKILTERGLSYGDVARLATAAGHPISRQSVFSAAKGKPVGQTGAEALAAALGLSPSTFLPSAAISFIPLDALELSPKNERITYDNTALSDLAADIEKNGLLQNLVVYANPHRPGHYLVAGGGRRWRALVMLQACRQLPTSLADHGIPCKIVDSEDQAMILTIVENLRREDVHFLDRAAAYARLRDELGWSATQISDTVGVTNDSVTQYLRIHDRLDNQEKLTAMKDGITFKQAREMVAIHREPPLIDTPPADKPGQDTDSTPPKQPARPVSRLTIRRDGEVSWPSGWGCMGYFYQGGRLNKIHLVDRLTGKIIPFVAAQTDIEDSILVEFKSSVADRLRDILFQIGNHTQPVQDKTRLEDDLGLTPDDAVHIGQLVAVEFDFPSPPFIADPSDHTGFDALGLGTFSALVSFIEKRLDHHQQKAPIHD